ncbi:peptide-methionine (S)-S-oxide reductase [Algoriphagus aquimarinus]|mgnify:CR=1 FL=1|uniref:peptide-methionine (S)-S-oxide reductase n=1 Tax=Algoriphagus aquimarinus TaxID=237018 RepID=A0A1I1ARQ3_9BACT|nr:peptide-methionine (S)-S-oxide reductase [Algoriphagus aquimarinus]SFB40749.1 peptide-methionine (S)-S-oxide reductase [Algoriphagus aquimarinus]|tara:strand:+ start:9537 stop:10022 length:486 start_codon:yes stop_codon:yes gene_type:complete
MSELKIGFGGGCHWCTEAVFQALRGVSKVDQGWIASEGKFSSFSEAVMVTFDSESISLKTLIEIHLLTHASTSAHSFRSKYRSAIYYEHLEQKAMLEKAFEQAQEVVEGDAVTMILPLAEFKKNEEEFLNYYQSRPDAPFCQTYISPKLDMLRKRFTKELN